MLTLIFRKAVQSDLSHLIALLADDEIGQTREVVSDPVDGAYIQAFRAIGDDPNQLLVTVLHDETIIGCMQLSYIPGLSRSGMWRGQIESVRIAAGYRDQGIGRRMIEWAISNFKERGCGLVQLTSDKTRLDALRFYASLGFNPTHEGYKLSL
ncbi:GNAT family N-acetyltransferase [Phyllobacterium sp. YR531]|uniref:GNAT family N-acetyltransferase n=1 Tax=Phyllobacterium sp. YR531 TaxID=1144343 RepID=UPI00026FB286|nr:GNAT family N-acetyltransferase [Phyllobacterium sp. YR531]EJN02297.1 acetyltransferase [Phyllobacterium sp. YR531]